LRAGLLRALDPAAAGLVLAPVKEEALEGARASTDFGGLFVGFSFFLIVASIVLAAMLWRLACERRSRELGTLSACGYGPSILTGLLFREGMVATLAGALVGTAGALGYAAALIYGLRTVWAEAINAPFLALHASASSLCIGLVSTIFIAAVTVVTVAAVMARASPVRLLAGGRGAPTLVRPRGFRAFWPLGLAATALALAVGAIVAGLTGGLELEPSFFSAGAALLVASLAYFRHVLVRRRGRGRRRASARGRRIGDSGRGSITGPEPARRGRARERDVHHHQRGSDAERSGIHGATQELRERRVLARRDHGAALAPKPLDTERQKRARRLRGSGPRPRAFGSVPFPGSSRRRSELPQPPPSPRPENSGSNAAVHRAWRFCLGVVGRPERGRAGESLALP
jgi:hypothetical protein